MEGKITGDNLRFLENIPNLKRIILLASLLRLNSWTAIQRNRNKIELEIIQRIRLIYNVILSTVFFVLFVLQWCQGEHYFFSVIITTVFSLVTTRVPFKYFTNSDQGDKATNTQEVNDWRKLRNIGDKWHSKIRIKREIRWWLSFIQAFADRKICYITLGKTVNVLYEGKCDSYSW